MFQINNDFLAHSAGQQHAEEVLEPYVKGPTALKCAARAALLLPHQVLRVSLVFGASGLEWIWMDIVIFNVFSFAFGAVSHTDGQLIRDLFMKNFLKWA